MSGEPVHVVADQMTADLNAAVVAVGRLATAMDFGSGIIEVAPDLVVQAGLIILEHEQIVAAAV